MSKEYLNHNINQKETSSANHKNHNINISLSLPLKRHKGAASDKARVIVFGWRLSMIIGKRYNECVWVVWLTAASSVWLFHRSISSGLLLDSHCAGLIRERGGEIYPININSIDLTIPYNINGELHIQPGSIVINLTASISNWNVWLLNGERYWCEWTIVNCFLVQCSFWAKG